MSLIVSTGTRINNGVSPASSTCQAIDPEASSRNEVQAPLPEPRRIAIVVVGSGDQQEGAPDVWPPTEGQLDLRGAANDHNAAGCRRSWLAIKY
jgi:hypothetical protein